jgi:hypothetical protein
LTIPTRCTRLGYLTSYEAGGKAFETPSEKEAKMPIGCRLGSSGFFWLPRRDRGGTRLITMEVRNIHGGMLAHDIIDAEKRQALGGHCPCGCAPRVSKAFRLRSWFQSVGKSSASPAHKSLIHTEENVQPQPLPHKSMGVTRR